MKADQEFNLWTATLVGECGPWTATLPRECGPWTATLTGECGPWTATLTGECGPWTETPGSTLSIPKMLKLLLKNNIQGENSLVYKLTKMCSNSGANSDTRSADCSGCKMLKERGNYFSFL